MIGDVRMIRCLRAAAAVVAGMALLAGCGTSEPASVHLQARRIEGQVWSPYCPGRLLADCTTGQAFELRERIEGRLEDGQSPDQVLAWLRTNYGDEVLARPATDRRGITIWLIPGMLLLAGAALVATLVGRWSRRTPAPPDGSEPPASDPWVERVRDEVRRDL